MYRQLTVESLKEEAATFVIEVSSHDEPNLYGITDGKAVGTFLESRFQALLHTKYIYEGGNAAKGIDFPSLNVDIKVTSCKQPQSSSPFRSAQQKVLGLGYSLLIFVYLKTDDHTKRTGNLNILHTVFVDASRTGDYQTTRGILDIIDRDGNTDDIVAYLFDRNLPIVEFEAERLAEELLENPPHLGYLTISNALQWRLQYKRVIDVAGTIDGIVRVS